MHTMQQAKESFANHLIPGIGSVLLERKTENGDSFVGDGIEQLGDDLVGESPSLPVVDLDHL